MGKTDIAYEYIKGKIISGEYPPLSDLSEDTLQQELNVSRTPVREAILRLEKEDFVYVYPRKGTIVTDLTNDLLEEVFEVREAIEPVMAMRNINQIKQEWLLDIKKRLLEPPAGLSEDALREYYVSLDEELHTKIIEGCPNRYMRRLMKNIQDQNMRLRLASTTVMDDDDHTMDEHLQIIDSILERDREKLGELLLFHLKESKKKKKKSFRN